ncbi:MAG: protease HtpX [Chlamydiae bacterium]|nr:protease HtpX [Chlamydiota bacterium]
MVKRIVLFLMLNLLVISTISFLLYLFNVQPFLSGYGLNIKSLMLFCLIWGMGGSFISLLLSKQMAKWMMGVEIIDPSTQDKDLQFLLSTVKQLSEDAGLAMPQVGVYSSNEVNAFATGATKNSSLVAVSSGLLGRMNQNDISAIIGHEISHIANGDMITMTLLQGVVNAFVMFLARILASIISGIGNKEKSSSSSYASYHMSVFLFEMVFMILGSLVICAFSRHREYKADAGGAHLAGKEKMIEALKALKSMQEIKDPAKETPAFATFKISHPPKKGLLHLFATHPPIEERIERLQEL